MQQKKSVIQYFQDGFFLANKSLDVFLINFFLLIPLLMNNVALNAISLLINMGFTLSIPLLLTSKDQGKHLGLGYVFNVTARNVKRIMLPAIPLFFLSGILAFMFFGAWNYIFHPTEAQINIFLQNGQFFLIIVSSLFIFTPFYFSLENNGLFTSMKKSIGAFYRNLNFILVAILLNIFIAYISNFIPPESLWGQLLGMIINLYIALTTTASCLFYYQKVIKKNNRF